MINMQYGLIGEKLSHSFSKPIHEALSDYEYEIKEIPREELDAFMKKADFKGINVTIPYKSQVISYLHHISQDAQRIGAVNTVVNRQGKLYGYNTDFGGMKMLLEKAGFEIENSKVLIFGSGGTSKTANAVCRSLGAREAITVSRSGEVNYENAHILHGDCDYIINTTPCGMFPDNDSLAGDPALFKDLKGIADAVYNPLKTSLVQRGEALGIKGVTGLYMLVCQAVLACEIFTEACFDRHVVAEKIYSQLVRDKRNIVLIGMPGSGKSTVGSLLAEMTGKQFIDTDEMIKLAYGDISEIFKNHGEEYFREKEAEAVKEAAKQSGKIIATGGGVILREENLRCLRQNGTLVFLDRALEDIMPTADRPLSSNYTSLKKRYEERYDKYVAAADITVNVSGSPRQLAENILEKLK